MLPRIIAAPASDNVCSKCAKGEGEEIVPVMESSFSAYPTERADNALLQSPLLLLQSAERKARDGGRGLVGNSEDAAQVDFTQNVGVLA